MILASAKNLISSDTEIVKIARKQKQDKQINTRHKGTEYFICEFIGQARGQRPKKPTNEE